MNDLEVVKSVLAERVDISSVKEDDLLTSLGLDSLDLVEVALEIEEKLNIEFTSEEITELKTLKDVLKLIEAKRK